MLHRGALAVAVVSGVATTTMAVAVAQPDEETQRKAGDLVQRGIALQGKQDTAGAVALYEEAYCLIPEPALVYNIGTAYQEAGRAAEAQRYFRLYLKVAPGGELAGDAKAAIKALGGAGAKATDVAAITCKPAAPPCPDGAVRVDGECPAAAAPPASCPTGEVLVGDRCMTALADGGGGAPGGTTEGTVSRGGRGLFYAGVATTGIGAVGLGVGIYFGLKAKDASDAISANMGDWTPELLAKEQEGKDAERNQIIFTAVGGAALAGGLVMIWLGLRDGGEDGDEAAARFTPYVSDEQAGFAVTGSY
jgi:tetratricopeptide (TPR) repeat protein